MLCMLRLHLRYFNEDYVIQRPRLLDMHVHLQLHIYSAANPRFCSRRANSEKTVGLQKPRPQVRPISRRECLTLRVLGFEFKSFSWIYGGYQDLDADFIGLYGRF